MMLVFKIVLKYLPAVSLRLYQYIRVGKVVVDGFLMAELEYYRQS